MSTRLLIAYVLIALMAAAFGILLWYLTKGRRRIGRQRRAHDRSRREAASFRS